MKKYSVILNEQFGYRMLDPMPSEDELNKFYSENYYELMKNSDSQSMDKFIKDKNSSSDEELIWLEKTEYEDVDKKCHKMRKNLELGLSSSIRRRLYNSFSEIGIGRNIIIYGILE